MGQSEYENYEEIDFSPLFDLLESKYKKKPMKKYKKFQEKYHSNLNQLCLRRYGKNSFNTFTTQDDIDGILPFKRGTLNNLQKGKFPRRKSVREQITRYFDDEPYIDELTHECVPKTKDKIGINTYWDFVLYLKYGEKNNYPCTASYSSNILRTILSEGLSLYDTEIRDYLCKKFNISHDEWEEALYTRNSFVLANAAELEEFFNLSPGILTDEKNSYSSRYPSADSLIAEKIKNQIENNNTRRKITTFLKHFGALDSVLLIRTKERCLFIHKDFFFDKHNDIERILSYIPTEILDEIQKKYPKDIYFEDLIK